MTREAFIYDAIRTPRGKGKPGGALYEVKPVTLLSSLLRELQSRNQFETATVDDVVMGCVTPVGDQGADIAKTAALAAGWDWDNGGVTLNRFCASGAEAVNLAAAKIRSGWEELIVAGGVESMSRVPMGSDGGAWAADPRTALDTGFAPQGIGADLIATLAGFSREDVDAFALASQQKASAAWSRNAFECSVVPVRDQNGLLILDRDELVRPDTSMEGLAQLRPAFAGIGEFGFDAVARQRYPQVERINHVHTAGNSSGIVDGAAALLVGSEEAGQRLNLKPRARVVSAAVVGTDPTIMLTGPAPATRKALKLAGLRAEDIDLFEVNEAFAAVVMRFQRELDVDPERINVNGGSIAMGHPLGATGAILIGTLLDELEQRRDRYGLVTLCVGGGMGVATIIERL
ncbi:acetyl-CoA acetyltransferase [Microbulbifer flavimaris]|uniref:Acetyl-CoA acetyltransferase n=1 Tax=Microbulbifer flavimaris TaxID=1781068 RepID=A0ABX4I0C7_9GAMM|nr:MULTISPECIES: acetyl-CoA C-acetyltransferase [Microbulbifer]KUJ83682.1 acetyl-CoA acetyltransferase [Microbulbifer sp. ZGT114]PCO05849.1 acetyl-CoA acetyltransferase [Microbulbifer flavimaris]